MKKNKITVEVRVELVNNSPRITLDEEVSIEDLEKTELIKAIHYLESGGKFLYKCDPSKNVGCSKTGCIYNNTVDYGYRSMTTSKPYAADEHSYVIAGRKGLVQVK